MAFLGSTPCPQICPGVLPAPCMAKPQNPAASFPGMLLASGHPGNCPSAAGEGREQWVAFLTFLTTTPGSWLDVCRAVGRRRCRQVSVPTCQSLASGAASEEQRGRLLD